MWERNKTAVICLVLLLVPFAVFYPTLEAGFLNWDDDVNVFENPGVHGITYDNLVWMFSDFGHAIRYKPLSWLGWAVVYEIFGLNPFGYHLANVLVHCLNTLLLFLVLRHLVRLAKGMDDIEEGDGFPVWVCVFGALFWSLHPMRVEPVAWVTGFPYGSALLLLLSATILYLRSQDATVDELGRRWSYRASVFAYGLSVITYPIVLGFPAVLIAIDFFPLHRFVEGGRLRLWNGPARRAWLGKLPYFAIALSLVALTLYGRFRHTEYWIQPASMADFGFGARLMQAAHVWAYYVWKPLIPTGLSPVYTSLIWNDPVDVDFVLSLVFVLGLSVLLVIKWREWPMLLAVWVAHLGSLAPMLGLTERPHYEHDRYGIINGIFWSVLLVAAVLRFRGVPAGRKWGLVMGVLFLAGGSVASLRYSRVWRDDVSFFRHMATHLGENEFRNLALMNLGEALVAAGRYEEAIGAFEEAERRDVLWVFPFDFQRLALSHGIGLLNLGRFESASGQFRKALEINPNSVAGRNNLAIALWKAGDLTGAIEEFRTAERIAGPRPDLLFNLGKVLLEAGRSREALPVLERAWEHHSDKSLVGTLLAEARRRAAGQP